MIKLFQIYYNENQKSGLVDGFIPHLNENRSIYVENQCIYEIRQNKITKNTTHVGVFSHKFHDKILSKPTLKTISTCIMSNLDGDIFSPRLDTLWWSPLRQPRPLYFPNQCNIENLAIPFLRDLADVSVMKHSSIDLWIKSYPNPIYCNFWVAKKDIFIDYVDNFLTGVFKVIESYNRDNPIFTIDHNYPSPPPQIWKESTGFAGYPVITFIMERLINIYIQDRSLKHLAII